MGQTKKRNYDRYTLAFKLQAVRMANHPDVMSKVIAESLGIHPFMLSRWKKDFREGKLPDCVNEEGLMASIEEHKRIRELENKVSRLEIKNDLLKKAIQFDLDEKQPFRGKITP